MQTLSFARAIRLGTIARLAAAIVISGTAFAACSDETAGTTTPRLVSVYSGSGQSALVATADSQPLVVLVSDGDSHGVAGVQVSFVATGGAVISTSTATTDANGLASITVSMDTVAGTKTVTATIGGVVTQPAVFSLIASPGAPVAIVAEAGNNQVVTVGSMVALAALVTDQYGNPIPNATINWTTTAGTIGPIEFSDSTGVASDILQLPTTTAVATVTATVDGTALKATFTDTSM